MKKKNKFITSTALSLISILLICQSGFGQENQDPYILVLGVAQDAGYPQAGCYAEHCMRAWNNPQNKRLPTSFALIDPKAKKKWLFEATPDIKDQLFKLQKVAPDSSYQLAGIFLTHGHMGHYTGLMQLGREAMGAKSIPVYAMPRMKRFLSNNGPWSQLVKLNNIEIREMTDSVTFSVSADISILPFTVPHRDEFTETAGYSITMKGKKLVFIPDIDKWNKWDVDINKVVSEHDLALLDATFYTADELPGRNMSEIPHPFVEESMSQFVNMTKQDKAKVHFIHFNHSNPLLIEGSTPLLKLIKAGYNIARENEIIRLLD